MKRSARIIVGLLLLVVTASTLVAQETETKKKKKRNNGRNAAVERLFQLPKEIQLTAEQKEKLAEVRKEFKDKAVAAVKRVNEALTPEQWKARREATKTARAAKKQGKELREAVDAAVELSPEQKKKLAEAQKETASVRQAFRAKVATFLTEEQKSHLPKPRAARAKGAKKKKKAADNS